MSRADQYPPVTLLVGGEQETRAEALNLLQAEFCPQKGCRSCAICQQLAERRFYRCLWLRPEKQQYSRADVEGILEQLAFLQEAHQRYFFVIESAELLTAAVANSLLKSFEEPPAGYHFLLLTDRPALLLPTVRSRAVERFCGGVLVRRYEPLLAVLRKPSLAQMGLFSEQLTIADLTEQETLAVLDELVASLPHERAASPYFTVIQQAYQELPMPGSAKLFWRTLFLKLVLADEISAY